MNNYREVINNRVLTINSVRIFAIKLQTSKTLVARGATVDVGVIKIQESVNGKRVKKQLEIDFIVNLGTKKIYIQSAYQMPTKEKLHQEVRGLKRIKDSFRKIVVVGDPQPMYTDDCGITYVRLMAFMLDKSILEKVG